MAKFKDFGSPINDTSSEPITFKLYGEDFHCRPKLPGRVMLDFASRTANDASAADNAAVITDFFRYVLVDESFVRFDALCVDPDRIVTIEQIMSIVEWLMEVYTDRPTERSEVLSPGQ